MIDANGEVRPNECTDDVLEYLDELRESGETNMYGAGPYLQAEFGFSRLQASKCLTYWMHTFSDRHPKEV